MPLTQFDICSNALTMLGSDPITSFTGKPMAIKCGALYPMVRSKILGSYPWNFTLKRMQLSKLVETPATKHKYYYDIPDDCLIAGAVALYDTADDGAEPYTNWVVIGDKIAADAETLFADYPIEPNEAYWPPYFSDLMSRIMMVDLCMSVTKDKGFRDQLSNEVYGPPSMNRIGGEVGQARQLSAQSAPKNNRMANFILLTSRYASVGR